MPTTSMASSSWRVTSGTETAVSGSGLPASVVSGWAAASGVASIVAFSASAATSSSATISPAVAPGRADMSSAAGPVSTRRSALSQVAVQGVPGGPPALGSAPASAPSLTFKRRTTNGLRSQAMKTTAPRARMTTKTTIGVLGPPLSDGAPIGVPVGVTAVETTGDAAGVAAGVAIAVTVAVALGVAEGTGDDTGVATGVDSSVMPGGGGK